MYESHLTLVLSFRNKTNLHRPVFSLTILLTVQDKVVNILVNTTSLRINLNIDGETTPPKTHTHPSHSETSRLLTSL